MAGVFDAVEKLKRIYTYYNPVNNPYQKYYFKGSLLAEDNDPQKDETRMDRLYNLINSINSNTEQIKESATEKRSKYEDVYFKVPTIEKTESGTREEPEKTEKSEEVVPDYPSLNIDNPIKSVGKTRENINVKQTQSYQSDNDNISNMSFEDMLKKSGLSDSVHITSHWRDKQHNKSVGGAERSEHLQYVAKEYGSQGAFDVVPKGMTFKQLRDKMLNNDLFVQWMKYHRYNLIDELDKNHFHIGTTKFNQNRKLTWLHTSA